MFSKTLIAAAAVALAVPGVASAATDTATHNLASATQSLGTYHVDGWDTQFITAWDVDVSATASWKASMQTQLGWNPDLVRRNATLSVSRSIPQLSGMLKVTWKISGKINQKAIATRTVTADVACAPALQGAAECTATLPKTTLLETIGEPGSPYAKLALKTKFKIAPDPVTSYRSFIYPSVSSSSFVKLTDDSAIEQERVACAALGSKLDYRLKDLHYAPAVTVTGQPTIQVGRLDSAVGLVELPPVGGQPFGEKVTGTPAFDLTGASEQRVTLGTLGANNVKPELSFPASFSGAAGQPILFAVNADDECPIASYVWTFSDFGAAYGKTPSHVFASPGDYTGHVTVTDVDGVTATRDFRVLVTS